MFDVDTAKPRIGISACILGQAVRFNGGHGETRLVSRDMAPFFQWVPLCPEVEAGMGIPRETVRLTGSVEAPRITGGKSGRDWTTAIHSVAESLIRQFRGQRLHGFILKKKSPTCGLERVPVYGEKGNRVGTRAGMFAAALREAFPLLPMEEDGRLHDPRLREHFLVRVFAFHRWMDLLESNPRPTDLTVFHGRHKFLLLAHNQNIASQLGRIAADAGKGDFSATLTAYGAGFMACLACEARPGRHANVLYHIMGFFKRRLDGGDKAELTGCIEAFRRGRAPLSVPLTLILHYLRRFPHPWLAMQTYLRPYPGEFLMRQVL